MPQHLLLRSKNGSPRQPAKPQSLERQAEAVLRELAYVLHLTRRIRSEIEAERR